MPVSARSPAQRFPEQQSDSHRPHRRSDIRNIRTIAALSAAALSLAAAPGALARTSQAGNAAGNPNANICVASIDCPCINFKHGKPTDVVRHTSTLTSWTLHAASAAGQVELRVLRPVGGGAFKAIHSSALRTVSALGRNTFPAHIEVKKGDVLALSNATSGLYMQTVQAGTCVRYFDARWPTAQRVRRTGSRPSCICSSAPA